MFRPYFDHRRQTTSENANDALHDIGDTALRRTDLAMRIGRVRGTGPLTFLGNIQVIFSSQAQQIDYDEIVTECGILASKQCRMQHRRDECSVPRNHKYITTDWSAVLSYWPHSVGIVQHAPFKFPCKKGPDERPRLIIDRVSIEVPQNQKYTFSSIDEMTRWTQSRPYDYFEKEDYLTAADFQNAIDVPFPNEPKNPKVKRKVLGVCENFHSCFEELKQSPEVLEILELIQKGIYCCTPKVAHMSQSMPLFDSTKAISTAIVYYAVAQALAGPRKRDQSYFMGKPVTRYIQHICKEQLHRANRRTNPENQESATDSDVLERKY